MGPSRPDFVAAQDTPGAQAAKAGGQAPERLLPARRRQDLGEDGKAAIAILSDRLGADQKRSADRQAVRMPC
jgi:hypothetical protein